MKQHTKCLIIGSGPAGYTAAIYASRANLHPIEYSGLQPGGQLTQTTEVENFPGYPNGIDGNQMMMELREQAERFGADIRDGSIVKADLSKRPYLLTDEEGNEIEAETVIIATGASAKYLGLDDERKYNGQGVSACATCDGFFYRKKVVAVVGGGDTACEDALYLSHLAKKVYLIVRKPYLRASKVMQQRVMEAENIEILFEHNTVGLFGDKTVFLVLHQFAQYHHHHDTGGQVVEDGRKDKCHPRYLPQQRPLLCGLQHVAHKVETAILIHHLHDGHCTHQEEQGG